MRAGGSTSGPATEPPAGRAADPDLPDTARGSDSDATEGEAATPPSGAFYLYGITRSRMWRPVAPDGVTRLRYRGLEALTRVTVFETPEVDETAVAGHQRVLDAALRRGTVLPAPFGIVLRDRRRVIRLLQDQYDRLVEGLDFLDGHWELRIHMTPAGGNPASAELSDLAMQVYTELRRGVRAAVPFPREGDQRLLSAAFLVERSAWLDFMQRADEIGNQHPELTFDITGPWPAYDFVRLCD